MCDNGALKEKNILVAKKGLTHALAFPKVFKVEWIKIVLSRIHDMKLWLEKGPIKITKSIIHQVTRYPTIDKVKSVQCQANNIVEELTKAKWSNRGMSIDGIHDPVIEFVLRGNFSLITFNQVE